jgi:hypothetical protein
MRGNVLGRYFSALSEGDPVALIATGVFIAFLVIVGIVVLKGKSEEKREAERKRKKWGVKDN